MRFWKRHVNASARGLTQAYLQAKCQDSGTKESLGHHDHSVMDACNGYSCFQTAKQLAQPLVSRKEAKKETAPTVDTSIFHKILSLLHVRASV